MRSDQHVHPQDEFDTVARSGPRGMHREPRSRMSRAWPWVAVLVLVPVLAFGVVTWLSNWDGLPGALDPGFTEETDPANEPTPSTSTPGEEEEPSATPTQTPEPPPADLGSAVEVFNATGTSGLAAGAATRLQEAGFTQVETGNWQQEDPPASVVLYPAAADEGTAQAAADELGIGSIEESADVTVITVVLAADYQP